jgi:hypothetical protein
MKKTTKDELIAKYQEREPAHFIQYDIFLNAQADDVAKPDEDGDAIFITETFELMRGSDVRIFVKPGTPPGRVRNALKKIQKIIKKAGLPDFSGPSVVVDPFKDW